MFRRVKFIGDEILSTNRAAEVGVEPRFQRADRDALPSFQSTL
jgi:hypothetical protein